jgi:hypothetical protein
MEEGKIEETMGIVELGFLSGLEQDSDWRALNHPTRFVAKTPFFACHVTE